MFTIAHSTHEHRLCHVPDKSWQVSAHSLLESRNWRATIVQLCSRCRLRAHTHSSLPGPPPPATKPARTALAAALAAEPIAIKPASEHEDGSGTSSDHRQRAYSVASVASSTGGTGGSTAAAGTGTGLGSSPPPPGSLSSTASTSTTSLASAAALPLADQPESLAALEDRLADARQGRSEAAKLLEQALLARESLENLLRCADVAERMIADLVAAQCPTVFAEVAEDSGGGDGILDREEERPASPHDALVLTDPDPHPSHNALRQRTTSMHSLTGAIDAAASPHTPTRPPSASIDEQALLVESPATTLRTPQHLRRQRNEDARRSSPMLSTAAAPVSAATPGSTSSDEGAASRPIIESPLARNQAQQPQDGRERSASGDSEWDLIAHTHHQAHHGVLLSPFDTLGSPTTAAVTGLGVGLGAAMGAGAGAGAGSSSAGSGLASGLNSMLGASNPLFGEGLSFSRPLPLELASGPKSLPNHPSPVKQRAAAAAVAAAAHMGSSAGGAGGAGAAGAGAGAGARDVRGHLDGSEGDTFFIMLPQLSCVTLDPFRAADAPPPSRHLAITLLAGSGADAGPGGADSASLSQSQSQFQSPMPSPDQPSPRFVPHPQLLPYVMPVDNHAAGLAHTSRAGAGGKRQHRHHHLMQGPLGTPPQQGHPTVWRSVTEVRFVRNNAAVTDVSAARAPSE